jgi:GxxExxY protein
MEAGNKLDILYKDEAYKIIGAAMTVHNEIGFGFLEAVYQEALEKEFRFQCIPFQQEVPLPVYYKGEVLSKKYFADFVCYNKIIVELKAITSLSSENRAQVLNYLKATKFELGLLINFGESKLKYERLVNIIP